MNEYNEKQRIAKRVRDEKKLKNRQAYEEACANAKKILQDLDSLAENEYEAEVRAIENDRKAKKISEPTGSQRKRYMYNLARIVAWDFVERGIDTKTVTINIEDWGDLLVKITVENAPQNNDGHENQGNNQI